MSEETEKIGVVIVEDDEVQATHLARLLDERDGYSIHIFKTAEDAWTFIRDRGEPLIALIDIGLPGMNGMELLNQIRIFLQNNPQRFIFPIVVSGLEGQLVGALHFGAKSVIHKPKGLQKESIVSRVNKPIEIQTLFAVLDQAKEAARLAGMRSEGIIDALTGFLNQKHVLQKMEEEVEKVNREKTNSAILFIDLDDLKGINTRYSHESGTQVIRIVAERLRKHVRPYDIVGKYGGDEFVVIFCGIDLEEAKNRAVQMSEFISQNPVKLGNDLIRATVTIAVLPIRDQSAAELVKKASFLLLKGKKHGKNCVIFLKSGRTTFISKEKQSA